jgi:hypothetical protein
MWKVTSILFLLGLIVLWAYSIFKLFKWKTLQPVGKLIWFFVALYGLIAVVVFLFSVVNSPALK